MTATRLRTGEQNKDFGPSRVACDWKDTNIVRDFFQERNPFKYGSVLCNIANGVHAQATVNVDDAEIVGNNIISQKVDEKVDRISFWRKELAVTLASKSSVMINGEGVQFDPQVLFQRLALAGHGHIDDAFDYELCVFPPALAKSPDLLHEPQKAKFADAKFADAIWANIPNKDVEIPKPAQYVIDGGALLHRIPWTRGETFDHILKSYTGYVHKQLLFLMDIVLLQQKIWLTEEELWEN